jgi:hypothetical protein
VFQATTLVMIPDVSTAIQLVLYAELHRLLPSLWKCAQVLAPALLRCCMLSFIGALCRTFIGLVWGQRVEHTRPDGCQIKCSLMLAAIVRYDPLSVRFVVVLC